MSGRDRPADERTPTTSFNLSTLHFSLSTIPLKDLRPGLLIDNSFALLRPIGEGVMGEVWLARDHALGRDVNFPLAFQSELWQILRQTEKMP